MADMTMPSNFEKEAVAVAIPQFPRAELALIVQRPGEPGEKLPCVWGLPAASLGAGETLREAASMVGRHKMDVDLELGDPLNYGRQERDSCFLAVTVYLADLLDGEPRLSLDHTDEGIALWAAWRWASPAALETGTAQCSLCSQLYLRWLRA